MKDFGFYLLNKPRGISSNKILSRFKRELNLPKKTSVGHTGTLDNEAFGLIFCGVGPATKLFSFLNFSPKVYIVKAKLGMRSLSDDGEGPFYFPRDLPPEDFLKFRLKLFLNQAKSGYIQQLSPWLSAKKTKGRRHYDQYRKRGLLFRTLKAVWLEKLEILSLDYSMANLEIKIVCGDGFYVRSLIREIGEFVGCGAYVDSLYRESLGEFSCPESFYRKLALKEALSHMVFIEVDQESQAKLKNGNPVEIDCEEESLWIKAGDCLIFCKKKEELFAPKKLIHCPENQVAQL